MKRRELFKKLACAFLGGALLVFPLGAGILFFLDPLRRTSRERGFVRVASLDSLPVGIPRKFTITGIGTDAWSTYTNIPIGAVYLLRREEGIDAFQVICPHAGCFVDYDHVNHQFRCPCHYSSFHLTGLVADPDSPAPRGLDRLEVKLQGESILVRYQEFRQGLKEKIAVT